MSDICAPALSDIYNKEIITQKSFPNNLKQAGVTAVFNKDDVSLLKSSSAVSFLTAVSKIYERIMQKYILEYIEKHLNPLLCGFRRGYSTQTALIFALENGHYP